MALQQSATVLMNLLLGELPHRLNPTELNNEKAIYEFGWKEDIVVVAAFVLVLIILRELVSEFLLKPLARKFGLTKSAKLIKFAEAAWFFMFYLPMCFWGLALSMRHRMSFPMSRYYEDWPETSCSMGVKLYMLLADAWYFHALFVVVFLQDRRKDFWESIIHHLTTNLLIFTGRYVSLLNVSVSILLLHCPSDTLLYLAKLFNYIEYKKSCDLVFAIFAVSFFLTRLVWLPAITWSWLTMAHTYNPDWSFNGNKTVFYGSIGCLVSLQVLHILWFRTICQMVIVSVARGGVEKDSRSDDD